MQTYHHSFKMISVCVMSYFVITDKQHNSFCRSFVCCAVVVSGEKAHEHPVSNRPGSVKQRFILIISIDPPDAVYWRNHSSIGLRNSNSWVRLYLSLSPYHGIQIQTIHQNCHCCTVICKRESGKKWCKNVCNLIFISGNNHVDSICNSFFFFLCFYTNVNYQHRNAGIHFHFHFGVSRYLFLCCVSHVLHRIVKWQQKNILIKWMQ